MDHQDSQLNQILPATFVGSFDHSLDPKKRLTIPSAWRQIIGEPLEIFIVPSFERPCLNGYRRPEMNELLQKLRQKAGSARQARDMESLVGSRSEQLQLDAQGRIRIKDELLAHAGITNQIKLTGSIGRFELWQPDAWNEKEQSTIQEMGSALKEYDWF